MGIDAWLLQVNEDDPITEIADCKNVLKHFVASLPQDIYPLLSSIQPYDDSDFFDQTARDLLRECDLALKTERSPEVAELLQKLKSLIEHSTRLPGSIVRFVGD